MTRFLLQPAPRWENPAPAATNWRISLKTITPMFGGGATPREIGDPPIRAASIRGHLRFWWRATTGAQYATAEKLHDVESALWGDTESLSKVTLRVTTETPGTLNRCGQYERNRSLPTFKLNYPSYALQPFQGKANKGMVEEEPSYCLENTQFSLTIICPDECRVQVERAIAAWIHFGGIGARTRRGCGSLSCADLQTPLHSVAVANSLLSAVPDRYFVGKPVDNALIAWKQAVGVYQDFRQKVGFARNEGREQNRPGRSRWPEADSIRRITRRYATGHEPIAQPERAFPRADLGLPIIFHFQSSDDPKDATLQGADKQYTRFASPVITKALAMPNGKFVPMIAVLQSPHVWENLDEKGKRVDLALLHQSGEATIRQADIAVAGRPMQERRQTDIRAALVAYAVEQGFKEVRL